MAVKVAAASLLLLAFTLLRGGCGVYGASSGVVGHEGGRETYWAERAAILRDEETSMLGGKLTLSGEEKLANEVVMKAKRKEIEDGFLNPWKFLPSKNFILSVGKIRESEVFKIIKEIPKGAILHVHDTAIVSSDYVYWNLTYRPNLYICEVNKLLKIKFFDVPNRAECDWQLLEEVRKHDKNRSIEHKILKQLSMLTKYPEKEYADIDMAWEKFMSIFAFIGELVYYRPVFEDYFYQGLLEFYNDKVLYLEFRSVLSPLYELNGTQIGSVEVAHIYKKVADRFLRDHPDFVGVKLIYAPLRQCTDKMLDEYLNIAHQLKKELPDFVVGFDLVGQEDKGVPLFEFASKLQAIGDDVHVFFHAGETNWYGTSTDENLIDAVLLNSKRIGHGYALLKHPKVMEIARQKNIAIEVSPISNQVLNLVKDIRNHPASVFFAQDYPIVISNDDPGLWGAQGLSYDFYEAFMGMMSQKADLRSLKALCLNSIKYSSMDEDEKSRALKVWSSQWETFIRKIASRL